LTDCIKDGVINTSGSCIMKSLERHFNNHKSEFGVDTVEAYLDSAIEFLLERPKPGIQIKYDNVNKTYRKYDVSTNTLISYQNGKIITYFKPSTNIHYWNNELINGRLYKIY